tara:strand:+ start:275 stop:505 length:231 start_codon:yes stop_codon:yes gene_type:complete
MTYNISVEKGVEIPNSNAASGYGKYPWSKMLPGDSFFVSDKNLSKPGYRPTTPKFKTTSRVLTEHGEKGVRIWRTK